MIIKTAYDDPGEGLALFRFRETTIPPVRRLVEIDPFRPEAFLNLGICLASKGEEALQLPATLHIGRNMSQQ